jgi:hypothetical protein
MAPRLCLSEVVMRSVPLSFQRAESLSGPVVRGTSTVVLAVAVTTLLSFWARRSRTVQRHRMRRLSTSPDRISDGAM